MPYKTKELIKDYNKKYFARPEVIARAKIRNAQRRDKRKAYKKTKKGKLAEEKWRKKYISRSDVQLKIEIRNLRLRYGISKEQYDQMYEFQKGLCLICSKFEKNYM